MNVVDFQKLRVYQRSIEFLALTIEIIVSLPTRRRQSQHDNIAEGGGRRTTVDQAHSRVRVMKLIDEDQYAHGIEWLEGVVAMLTDDQTTRSK